MTMTIQNTILLGFLSLFILTLAGCSGSAGDPPHYFGNAVRQNIAAQVVNPDAPEEGTLEHEGTRASIAQGRYMTDKVEKPQATTTSSVQGSGGAE